MMKPFAGTARTNAQTAEARHLLGHLRRAGTIGLLTVALGLAATAPAYADTPPGASAVLYDTNSDGWYDAATLDTNHDGWVDEIDFDADQDGLYEAMAFDRDQNGVFESMEIDTDRDSWVNVIEEDVDQDGYYETAQVDTDFDHNMDIRIINGATAPMVSGPVGAAQPTLSFPSGQIGPIDGINVDAGQPAGQVAPTNGFG
jgi:hypothetical protein